MDGPGLIGDIATMLSTVLLVDLGLIRAGRKGLLQRYKETVTLVADMTRRQPMSNADDIRAMIVVGPGEEDEAREAYGDLTSDDQWLTLDDSTENWDWMKED